MKTVIHGDQKTSGTAGDTTAVKVRSEGSLVVSPSSTVVQASFTRLANTTAYAAGDAMSSDATAPAAITLACGRLAGLGGVITHALLLSSVAGTAADIDLYLFDTALAAASFQDNLAVAITDAELLRLQCVIEFASADSVTVGANRALGRAAVNQVFKCAAGSTNLYAVLVARGAYTPASAEVITIVLGVAQD